MNHHKILLTTIKSRYLVGTSLFLLINCMGTMSCYSLKTLPKDGQEQLRTFNSSICPGSVAQGICQQKWGPKVLRRMAWFLRSNRNIMEINGIIVELKGSFFFRNRMGCFFGMPWDVDLCHGDPPWLMIWIRCLDCEESSKKNTEKLRELFWFSQVSWIWDDLEVTFLQWFLYCLVL